MILCSLEPAIRCQKNGCCDTRTACLALQKNCFRRIGGHLLPVQARGGVSKGCVQLCGVLVELAVVEYLGDRPSVGVIPRMADQHFQPNLRMPHRVSLSLPIYRPP